MAKSTSKVSKATKPAALQGMGMSEYNGNPLIYFGIKNDNFGDKYTSISFGGGKASMILHAMAVNGVERVIAELGKIANGSLSDDDRRTLGLPVKGQK